MGLAKLSFALSILIVVLFITNSVLSSTPIKVIGLPGSSLINDTSYAGYITIDNKTDSNLFYWFFESRSNPATDPVVLWMTGGPGCSSELALLFENGAFSVNSDLTLQPNPYSWNSKANVLYIDQPYGTGFSYSRGSDVKNETEMADDMYIFLTEWFQTFKQYQNNGFYITGESFGGHYVPALAVRVLQGPSTFNLKGIAIGNGWVDPEVQYGSYGPFSFQNNLIDTSVYAKMNKTYLECQTLLNNNQYDKATYVCSEIMDDVLESAGNINIYNIKLKCIGPLCYDFNTQTKYMNLKETQTALGVNRKWATCSSTDITTKDIISSFRQDLPIVLAAGVPVVAYNGMLDLICNYVGGYEWTYSMSWPGQQIFDASPLTQWVINGSVVGYTKHAPNFTYVEVLNAGHMVPHDQPLVALTLLSKVIANDW